MVEEMEVGVIIIQKTIQIMGEIVVIIMVIVNLQIIIKQLLHPLHLIMELVGLMVVMEMEMMMKIVIEEILRTKR
jgi:hypothetical protein